MVGESPFQFYPRSTNTRKKNTWEKNGLSILSKINPRVHSNIQSVAINLSILSKINVKKIMSIIFQ